MRRSATITLAMPMSLRTITRTITAASGKPLQDRIREAVEAFARSRGVSWLAVEYDVVMGA